MKYNFPALNKQLSLLKKMVFLMPFFYGLLFSNVSYAGFLDSFVQGDNKINLDAHSDYLSRDTAVTIHPYTDFLAWKPDGKQIAACTAGSEVSLVDTQTWRISGKLKSDGKGAKMGCGRNIAYSSDGRLLASGDLHVHVWDTESSQLITTITNPFENYIPYLPYRIESIVFLPDSQNIAVAYTIYKKIKVDQGYVGSAVAMYDAKTGRQIWFQYLHGEIGVQRVSTPLITDVDGGHLIFGINERTLITEDLKYRAALLFLDTKTGKLVRTIEDVQTQGATALVISQDGRLLATGTETGVIEEQVNITTKHVVKLVNRDPVRVWDVTTGKLVQHIPVPSRVTCLAFAPDGIHLIIGLANVLSRETVLVANIKTGAVEQKFETSSGVPSSMAFSPDGAHFAVAGGDQLAVFDIHR